MVDKQWAAKQLLDPLIAAQPADEDGPGNHFGNSLAGSKNTNTGLNPSLGSNKAPVNDYPTPPHSASPKNSSFPDYRAQAFGDGSLPSPCRSPRQSSEIPTSPAISKASSINGASQGRRRGSSLTARFPGDQSHRPLDILRAEHRAANRPRRRTHIGADTIDRLDMIGANGYAVHHDGPYDAMLLARNTSFTSSPVAAVKDTNEAALRATPQEFINDSIQRHKPLSGTATIPPGVKDPFGRILNYEEGPNLNVEMGWRRWEGIKYHPDDIKGKGEPTFTLDRALKGHKSHRRIVSEGNIELRERPHGSAFLIHNFANKDDEAGEDEFGKGITGVSSDIAHVPDDSLVNLGGLSRANTTGRRTSAMASTLRSKFGSLRRRKHVNGMSVET